MQDGRNTAAQKAVRVRGWVRVQIRIPPLSGRRRHAAATRHRHRVVVRLFLRDVPRLAIERIAVARDPVIRKVAAQTHGHALICQSTDDYAKNNRKVLCTCDWFCSHDVPVPDQRVGMAQQMLVQLRILVEEWAAFECALCHVRQKNTSRQWVRARGSGTVALALPSAAPPPVIPSQRD